MSLNEEYKELDKLRKEDAEKSLKHYKSVDLPGTRTKGIKTIEARERIAAMNAERAKPS